MFASTIEPLLRYRRERFPLVRFVAIAALLSGAALLAARVSGATTPAAPLVAWARGTSLALLLVFLFRLWDDLADREHDRSAHPRRVLAGDVSLGPFRLLALGLGAMTAALLAAGPSGVQRLAAFAAIAMILALWYSARGRSSAGSLAGAHIVLLKYPAFVLLLGPMHEGAWLPRLGVMLLVFAMASAHEVLHDRRFRAAPPATLVILADAAIVVAVTLALLLGSTPPALTTLSGGPSA